MVLAIVKDDSIRSENLELIFSLSPSVNLESLFQTTSEEIVLNIFFRLEEDPRHLARLACVCRRFSNVIRDVCWKRECVRIIPDLLPCPTAHLDQLEEPPGGWGSLMKVLVCCPGLKQAGIISKSGLRSGIYEVNSGDSKSMKVEINEVAESCEMPVGHGVPGKCEACEIPTSDLQTCDTENAEDLCRLPAPEGNGKGPVNESVVELEILTGLTQPQRRSLKERNVQKGDAVLPLIEENIQARPLTNLSSVANYSGSPLPEKQNSRKRLRIGSTHPQNSEISAQLHFITPQWNLSRELGSKLLASRFWCDSLYVCDWPGCVHPGEKRNYKVFRGFVKNFKTSLLWRNLKNLKPRPTHFGCAFCSAEFTWDMMPAFCLRRSFEYHDDGEPVVHANVCENGHISGAWTDRPGVYAIL